MVLLVIVVIRDIFIDRYNINDIFIDRYNINDIFIDRYNINDIALHHPSPNPPPLSPVSSTL
jgi:hypothetical protein